MEPSTFQRSLARSPLALLGDLAARAGQPAEAEGWFRRALAAGHDRARIHLQAARAQVRAYEDSAGGRRTLAGSTPPRLLEARRLAERCLELDTGNPEALALLGRTFVEDTASLAVGVSALLEAETALHGRLDIVVDLVTLYANGGAFVPARELCRTRIEPSGDPRIIESVKSRLWRAARTWELRASVHVPVVELSTDEAIRLWEESQRAAADGNLDGAIASMEKALVAGLAPDVRPLAEDRLRRLRAVRGIQKALALAREGKLEAALSAFRKLLSEDLDDTERDRVKGHVRDLEATLRRRR